MTLVLSERSIAAAALRGEVLCRVVLLLMLILAVAIGVAAVGVSMAGSAASPGTLHCC